jgi:uncharacterized membrane protein
VKNSSWVWYTVLVVLTWGIWGGISAYPTQEYGYPDQWIYIIWSMTMLIPCYFTMRGKSFDISKKAIFYGCLIGLTGSGGQLLLFKDLTIGPAYLIFPIISISPAITVVMSMLMLKEKINKLGAIGVFTALISILMFSISSGDNSTTEGMTWLILAIVICICWGVQAYFMKKATNLNIDESSIFGYMTITALLLAPVAYLMIPDTSISYPIEAPLITAATQVLNAAGALFLVMALSRGKAVIVAPCTNALAPVLTAVISMALYETLPGVYAAIGIVLAITGSTLMVYSEEKSGEKASTENNIADLNS